VVPEARRAREARDAAREASSSRSGPPRGSLFGEPSLNPRLPSSYRLTSALGSAVAAPASAAVGYAREGVDNAVAATSRRGRRGDLVSDAALRRLVDRIAAEHRAFDSDSDAIDARLNAAVRGLSQTEIARLPDIAWQHPENRVDQAKKASEEDEDEDEDTGSPFVPDECAVCFVGFKPGDALKSLPCGHAGFHFACIRTWLERSPTCPLCRCACRSADGDGDGLSVGLRDETPRSGGVADPGISPDDPDMRSETFETHLAELTAMHGEESAWLDRLEAQPRRNALGETPAIETGRDGNGGSSETSPGSFVSSQVPDLPDSLNLTPDERRARFVPFDPFATSHVRRNYSELLRLREEERALVARLDRLVIREDELRARVADATRRRDEALRRRYEHDALDETGEGDRGNTRGGGGGSAMEYTERWRSNAARAFPERALSANRNPTRGAPAASFELAAAERDHHSRVSAVDALSRWRSSG